MITKNNGVCQVFKSSKMGHEDGPGPVPRDIPPHSLRCCRKSRGMEKTAVLSQALSQERRELSMNSPPNKGKSIQRKKKEKKREKKNKKRSRSRHKS